MLRGIVPKPVDSTVVRPPRGAVRHRRADFGTLEVKGRHERVEPRRQTVVVPTLRIQGSIGEVEVGGAVGSLLTKTMS